MDHVLENSACESKHILAAIHKAPSSDGMGSNAESSAFILYFQTTQGARITKRQFEGRRGDKELQCHQTGM